MSHDPAQEADAAWSEFVGSEAAKRLPPYWHAAFPPALFRAGWRACKNARNAAIVDIEEAGFEAYRHGFRNGHVDARHPEGFDGDERDLWREIDGVSVAEGWQNYRVTFILALTAKDPSDVA